MVAEQPPKPVTERIDTLLASVLAPHGKLLDDVEVAHLREQVERLRRALAALDAYHLENSDEPAVIVRVAGAGRRS